MRMRSIVSRMLFLLLMGCAPAVEESGPFAELIEPNSTVTGELGTYDFNRWWAYRVELASPGTLNLTFDPELDPEFDPETDFYAPYLSVYDNNLNWITGKWREKPDYTVMISLTVVAGNYYIEVSHYSLREVSYSLYCQFQ